MSAVNLSVIPKLEKLSPLVFRVLGCNPGPYTLQGTNTYLVGSGVEKILIDTGEKGNSEYINGLREVLSKFSWKIAKIVCTHWHEDHVGGIKDVVGKVVGSSLPVYKMEKAEENLDFAPVSGYEYVLDKDLLKVDGATLRVIASPGHTVDHISLWLEEEKALFSGDCILGEGTTVFEDLHSYMASLRKILTLEPQRIYPGHGALITEGSAKIQQYIDHRDMRETQILHALSTTKEPLSALQTVNLVYTDLVEPLKPAAAANVTHHLKKLVKDGKVAEKETDIWQFIDDTSKL